MDWLGAASPSRAHWRTSFGWARSTRQCPTCGIDDRIDDVRARLDGWDLCGVLHDERVVLGLV
jgi:hypothetical protein